MLEGVYLNGYSNFRSGNLFPNIDQKGPRDRKTTYVRIMHNEIADLNRKRLQRVSFLASIIRERRAGYEIEEGIILTTNTEGRITHCCQHRKAGNGKIE